MSKVPHNPIDWKQLTSGGFVLSLGDISASQRGLQNNYYYCHQPLTQIKFLLEENIECWSIFKETLNWPG